MRQPLTRGQLSAISTGIFWFVFLLVVLQLWLLTATMNAHMGGDQSVAWPALAASAICLVVNVWFLRRLIHFEK